MQNQKKTEWNESYKNGGDHLFYPHEEIIRFMNKYVRKKVGVDEYVDIMEAPEGNYKNIKGLDIGCGIGRHVKFMDEFGLDAYGFDLSEVAIEQGRDWFKKVGRQELANNLLAASITNLPYDDNAFDIAVSHSVFDSMSMDIAFEGMKEVFRVLKNGAYMYFDLLMKEKGEKVMMTNPGQKDTVRTFFDERELDTLLNGQAEIIERKIVIWEEPSGEVIIKRNHFIIKKK